MIRNRDGVDIYLVYRAVSRTTVGTVNNFVKIFCSFRSSEMKYRTRLLIDMNLNRKLSCKLNFINVYLRCD